MFRNLRPILGLSLIAALAACGQSSKKDPARSQPSEPPSNATSAQRTSKAFDPVETKMDDQMAAAVGADVGDSWVRKMIAHHQGAVDMSRVVLDQNPTAEVAKMAKSTIDKQGREVEDLKALERKGPPVQQTAEVYKPAALEMHQSMMEASGSTVSETYLRKMLAHHQGAVAMSDAALKGGVAGAVKRQIEKTKADQQKEAEMVKSMIAKMAG